MANTKQKTAAEAVATPATKVASTADTLTDFQKSVFTADEFANMSKQFNTTPDIVKAALKIAGVTETSFYEAEKIITKFKNKEV